MSSTAAKRSRPAPKQAIPAKIFHSLNILGLLLMTTSGLQIYNANPVFGGRGGWHFPNLVLLGGGLANGRHWHFAAMWLFSLNLVGYGIFILATRRWTQRFVSSGDLKALQASQNQKRKTYSWHRITYTAIVPILILAVLSGMGMYKPAQFPWIVSLFGSWQALRIVHFITVPTVVVFALVHSLLGLKVGGLRLIRSILW